MSPLKLAYLHLIRRRLSSLIALIGIALAVAASGTLLRLYLLSGARFQSMARSGDAIIGAKTNDLDILLGTLNLEDKSPRWMPYNLYLTLKNQVNVQFEDGAETGESHLRGIVPFLRFAEIQNFPVIGTEETFVTGAFSGLPILAHGNWAQHSNEVVLGSRVAEQLGLGEGVGIGSYKVVGVLKPTGKAWDRGIYANMDTAQEGLLNNPESQKSIWKNHVLHYALVYLKPGGREWLETLINNRTVSQVIFVPDEIQRLEELTSTGRDLGMIMTVVILLLGAFTVTAMMITRFESMTVQLAVLRALGYSKLQMTGVLTWEALLLGGTACVIGAGIDAMLFPWIRELLGSNLPAPEIVSIGLWQSSPVWIAALIGTLLSVLIPLWRLYRQNLHLSLRNL